MNDNAGPRALEDVAAQKLNIAASIALSAVAGLSELRAFRADAEIEEDQRQLRSWLGDEQAMRRTEAMIAYALERKIEIAQTLLIKAQDLGFPDRALRLPEADAWARAIAALARPLSDLIEQWQLHLNARLLEKMQRSAPQRDVSAGLAGDPRRGLAGEGEGGIADWAQPPSDDVAMMVTEGGASKLPPDPRLEATAKGANDEGQAGETASAAQDADQTAQDAGQASRVAADDAAAQSEQAATLDRSAAALDQILAQPKGVVQGADAPDGAVLADRERAAGTDDQSAPQEEADQTGVSDEMDQHPDAAPDEDGGFDPAAANDALGREAKPQDKKPRKR